MRNCHARLALISSSLWRRPLPPADACARTCATTRPPSHHCAARCCSVSGFLPMKYMEALKQCRKEHPFRRYAGVCSEITWDLSRCLKEEKKIVREPRQQRFQVRCGPAQALDRMGTLHRMHNSALTGGGRKPRWRYWCGFVATVAVATVLLQLDGGGGGGGGGRGGGDPAASGAP
jgi:hypothetical protein